MTEPVAPRRKRVAPLIALGVAAIVAALFFVLAGSDANTEADTVSFLVGKPAPVVATTRFDGQTFDLSRRKGSWVVLNFFNSTCLPCKAEHPDLIKFNDLQQTLGTSGAELYTVVDDDTDDNVTAWFAANGGDWPILRDDDGAISTAFGVAQIPETWIIDPSGIVRARFPGATTFEDLSATLETLRRDGA